MSRTTSTRELSADPARRARCLGRLLGKTRRSCRRWSLLPAEGRVAVAISGGWDSLALVELLVARNRVVEAPLALVGLHVALDAGGPTAGLPEPTEAWCRDHSIELVSVAPRYDPSESGPLDCFACARIRRRTLLEEAQRVGCTHLALGHHADDVVETWLLGLFYTGAGGVLPPIRAYFSGAVTVVRPLYELRRGELHRLGRLCGFPAPVGDCSRTAEARRDRVRAVLSALGSDQRLVRRQIFWAAVRAWEAEAGCDGERVDEG